MNQEKKSALPAKLSVPAIQSKKSETPITAVAAYDYTFAGIFDEAGIDIILVGDSMGTVIQGHPTTLPVTLEQILYHSRCVSSATKRALVVADLPFLSYQVSVEETIRNAGLLFKDGGINAVKLEGGVAIAATVEKLVSYDMPVFGHIGLTPQSYHRIGGNKVQGRINDKNARKGSRESIINDAKTLESAGAAAIVIECVPAGLAKEITELVSVPTIGIGSGKYCDGQILVSYDLLGLTGSFNPKFVKKYFNGREIITDCIKLYIDQVAKGEFPGIEHSFS